MEDITRSLRNRFTSQSLCSSTASQSSNSGWLGNSPCVPNSSLVRTRPVPKICSQNRFAITRAVSGFSAAHQPLRELQAVLRHVLREGVERGRRPFAHFVAQVHEVAAELQPRFAPILAGQLLHDRHGGRAACIAACCFLSAARRSRSAFHSVGFFPFNWSSRSITIELELGLALQQLGWSRTAASGSHRAGRRRRCC